MQERISVDQILLRRNSAGFAAAPHPLQLKGECNNLRYYQTGAACYDVDAQNFDTAIRMYDTQLLQIRSLIRLLYVIIFSVPLRSLVDISVDV